MPVEPRINITRIVRKYFMQFFLIQSVLKFFFYYHKLDLMDQFLVERKNDFSNTWLSV